MLAGRSIHDFASGTACECCECSHLGRVPLSAGEQKCQPGTPHRTILTTVRERGDSNGSFELVGPAALRIQRQWRPKLTKTRPGQAPGAAFGGIPGSAHCCEAPLEEQIDGSSSSWRARSFSHASGGQVQPRSCVPGVAPVEFLHLTRGVDDLGSPGVEGVAG